MSVGGRSSEGIAHYDVKKRKAAIAAALIMVQATTTVIGMASVLRDLTALEASAISRRMRKFVHKRHLDRVTKPSEPVERRAHYGTGRDSFNNHLRADGSNWSSDLGVELDEFRWICSVVSLENRKEEESLKDGNRTPRFLSLPASVAVCLYFLRRGPTIAELSKHFGIAPACAQRTLNWMIPLMRVGMGNIDSNGAQKSGEFQSYGAIDCSDHPRKRVHPGQSMWYRGDKRQHMLTSQVACDHLGHIMRVTVAKGHNNDQAVFYASRMKDWIEEENVGPLLADKGYGASPALLVPFKSTSKVYRQDPKHAVEYNRRLGRERVLIEHVNAWLKNWRFTDKKCAYAPEFQAACIVVCAQLTNLTSHRERNLNTRVMARTNDA